MLVLKKTVPGKNAVEKDCYRSWFDSLHKSCKYIPADHAH